MVWNKRGRLIGLCLALSAVYPVQQAIAHAILLEGRPAIGSTVTGPHVALHLRYNSRIDKTRSRLLLLTKNPDDPTPRTQTLVPIILNPAEDKIDADLMLEPGVYVIRWQVLAVDGHITRGDVPFTVIAQ